MLKTFPVNFETKYEIKRDFFLRGYSLVWVYFPECPYPNKIMLYTTNDWVNLKLDKTVNPHFNLNEPSPLARFVPNEAGWYMGIKLIETLTKK